MLLFGNGVLHGWGVQLRELAVPGQLAELVHRATGRAVRVDYVGEERMNAASARAWLGDAAGRGHDVAVVAVGLNDALRLTPLADWRAQMAGLLQRILAEQDPRARLLLVGLPRVRAFVMADSAMGSVAQRHADEMNLILQALADEHSNVDFVPAPAERFEPGRPIGSMNMYRAWAADLLPALLPALESVRQIKPVAQDPGTTWDWVGTPTALAADGSVVQQRLEAMTESIRQRYGVAIAGVNVIDGDEVYSVAGGHGGPRQMPRSLAYCDRTIRTDSPTVIENADEDPEFAGNPFLDVVGLPFYLGIPLHGSDGRPVATLCVLDSEPRVDIDPADLHDVARSAERELRAFETTAALQPSAPGGNLSTAHRSTTSIPPVTPDTIRLRVAAAVLRPVILAVLRGFLKRQARPHWDNRAVARGPRPIRVLLFGAGLAVGYGSDGADDPLPALIATALAAATGRGVIVETRARPSIALEQSLELLGRVGAATFDHVIWSPTLEEAARGTSHRWTRELTRIVGAVHATGPARLRMTLLGLPLVEGDHPLQRVGRVLGRQVNDRIEQVAAHSARTDFLPLPSRTVPDYSTPLFDTDYRSNAAALLVAHLLEQPSDEEEHQPSGAATSPSVRTSA